MNQINRTSLLALVVTILLAAHICHASDADLQYWTTGVISLDLTDDWKIAFEEELRFERDATLSYHHSDIGITYTGLAEWIDVGLNYRQVFDKNANGHWPSENRPHFNITLKTKVRDFALSNRLRFEYRERNNAQDQWRFRNKLTLKLPLKFTDFEIQPYLADEIFVDFYGNGLNRNRIYAGLSCKFSDNLKGNLYYLLQSGKSGGHWDNINAIGFQLKFNF